MTKKEIVTLNNLGSRKTTTGWKTTISSRKMTPTKKMTRKMTARIRNSPVATSVESRLGLTSLPSVKMMTDRLQGTHLPPAQIEANYLPSKPVIISSSIGVQKSEFTLLNRTAHQWGRSSDNGQGSRLPINQSELRMMLRSCQSTQGIREWWSNPPDKQSHLIFVRH